MNSSKTTIAAVNLAGETVTFDLIEDLADFLLAVMQQADAYKVSFEEVYQRALARQQEIQRDKFLKMHEKKAPEVEAFLDSLAQEFFGRSRKAGSCVTCDNIKVLTRGDFRDDLSWREFGISRMCQNCQDSIFNLEE